MNVNEWRRVQGLLGFGISENDALAIRRIAMTLHRWSEHECNGVIRRDEETEIPYWHSTYDGRRIGRAPDREKGAHKRLATIMARYPSLAVYHQGDPRGLTVYVYRHDDLDRFAARVQSRSVAIESCYNSIGCGI